MKCDSIHNFFEDDEESEVEKVEAGGEVPVHIWSCSVVASFKVGKYSFQHFVLWVFFGRFKNTEVKDTFIDK